MFAASHGQASNAGRCPQFERARADLARQVTCLAEIPLSAILFGSIRFRAGAGARQQENNFAAKPQGLRTPVEFRGGGVLVHRQVSMPNREPPARICASASQARSSGNGSRRLLGSATVTVQVNN